jgi:hypothetical protein
MKKTARFLSAIIFFFSVVAPAYATRAIAHKHKKGSQQWIVIGARGTFNNTWLLNSNLMNDKGSKYKASFGGGGGIMLGIHLSEVVAIEVEAGYGLINQKVASNIDSLPWKSRTSLGYLEFPILLHFDFQNFKYLEIGVKIGSLNSAKLDYSNDKYSALNVSGEDVKKDYAAGNTSLVFGWGTGLWGNGGLLVNFGIRATYGFSDIISDVGGKGADYYPSDGSAKTGYKPTNTATIGFHLSMDFDLGWFMTSSCGRSHKFVLFGH